MVITTINANLHYHEHFIHKLASLVNKKENKNKLMQGPQFNILNSNETVNGFKKKLELWKINTDCNIFDMSPTFERY
jgi:hypothetical protein